MQPRMLLAFFAVTVQCWLVVSLTARTPRSISAELLSSQEASTQSVRVHGVILVQVQDFAFPFVELHEVPLTSSACQSIVAQLFGVSNSSSFGIICKLAETALHPTTFRSLKERLNRISPSTLMVPQTVTNLHLASVLLITTL